MLTAGSTPTIQGLTVEQAEAVTRLSCLPAFRDLIAKVQADEVGADVPLPRTRPWYQGHLCPRTWALLT